MVEEAVPLQPMEVHSGAGGCPKEAVTQWGVHAGAGSWKDLWTCGERSPRCSRFAGRACDSVGGGTLEQFMKNCNSWEGLVLEQFMED